MNPFLGAVLAGIGTWVVVIVSLMATGTLDRSAVVALVQHKGFWFGAGVLAGLVYLNAGS